MAGDASRNNGRKGGRPQGALNQSTLRKQAIREKFLKRFEQDADAMYEAQRAQAIGTKFLVTRDPKTGKFVPLDEEQTKKLLESGDAERIEIWDRPPSTQAFVAIADRAIDKPTETHQVSGPEGGPIPIDVILKAARARLKPTQSGR